MHNFSKAKTKLFCPSKDHCLTIPSYIIMLKSICHDRLVFDKLLPIEEMHQARGDHSLLYFAYTCVRDLLFGGVIYLAKKIIRWWYFTCKKPANIICDGILHVNMFHYFKIPYFTCTFFAKFTYNEYIGPYFYRMLFYDFRQWTPRG